MRRIGDPRRNYGREWKSWRQARGWTQTDMALALRITRRTIVNIERGYTRPQTRLRLAFQELRKLHQEEAWKPISSV